MQQASATGKPEEPEATRTITLLVTCRQASSIIGEMGRRKKSIQDVTNTWVCICGTDDGIVLTLRVLAFTSAGIIFANACTNGICIAGAEPDKPRQHRGHHPTTQSSPSSHYPTGPAVFARRRAAPLASALPKSTLIAHALIAQA